MPTAAGRADGATPAAGHAGVLPAVALALMIGVIFLLQPRAMSYNGLRLLLASDCR